MRPLSAGTEGSGCPVSTERWHNVGFRLGRSHSEPTLVIFDLPLGSLLAYMANVSCLHTDIAVKVSHAHYKRQTPSPALLKLDVVIMASV